MLDQGYMELDGTGETGKTNLKPIKDSEDNDITTPTLLDGSGAAFEDPSTATPVYLTFDLYEEDNFSGLGV